MSLDQTNVQIENKSMTGTGTEVIGATDGLSENYRTTQIGVKGLQTGTLTVTAKGRNTDLLGAVVGGEITLSETQTLTITSDSLIEELGFAVSPAAPYTLSIYQSDLRVNERK